MARVRQPVEYGPWAGIFLGSRCFCQHATREAWGKRHSGIAKPYCGFLSGAKCKPHNTLKPLRPKKGSSREKKKGADIPPPSVNIGEART
jgi:hypothetical protein